MGGEGLRGLGRTGFRVLWKQYERRQYRVYGKRRIASQNREGFVPYAEHIEHIKKEPPHAGCFFYVSLSYLAKESQ